MDANALLAEFTKAVTSGDGTALAALFTEDGVYVDNFYGPFEGRAAIKDMLETHFHGAARDLRWDMRDPVSDGKRLYAHYVFSYVSKMKGSEGS